MKKLWIGAFVICGLVPLAVAQRGGGGMGGGIGGGMGFRGGGLGHFAGNRWGRTSRGQWGQSGWGQSGYGGLYGFPAAYNDTDADEQPPAVLVLPINVVPPEPPPPPPPPPVPPRPVISEYHWPDTGAPSATSFAIISRDGAVRYAIAVWAQDGLLCYTDPGGASVHIAFNAIDREATERVNAERGLKLWLANRR